MTLVTGAFVGFDTTPQAAEELVGTFGKVLLGLGVSCAVLSGIMGIYLASSRLMYSMARDGYLPEVFPKTIQSAEHLANKWSESSTFVISGDVGNM